jgi:hypothetical protein
VGSDPDDDLATLHLEFRTATGAPAEVDTDGDQILDGASFDLNATGTSQNGGFFVRNQFGLSFDVTVARILVTPVDGQALSGEERSASVTNAPTRVTGEACDPRGFDTCSAAEVCVPATTGDRSICRSRADVRGERCETAPLLEPLAGATFTFLRARGVSTWDPPVGCANPQAVSRSEAVARLRLAAAGRIRVSTALPETQADTILYVLPSCGTEGSAALSCQDDGLGTASELTLDLEAGDYVVIADSAREGGGAVGLEAVVQ